MRLIDADELIEQLTPPEDAPNNGAKLLLAVFVDAVKAFPTIDAVPVVRCKECVHRDPEDHKCDSGEMERAGCIFPVDDNYYCKYGRRREEGDNDG